VGPHCLEKKKKRKKKKRKKKKGLEAGVEPGLVVWSQRR
jgi:hypothetical protein